MLISSLAQSGNFGLNRERVVSSLFGQPIFRLVPSWARVPTWSRTYVLMEFHPFVAHGIALECGASDIRHKSTPNEAQSMSGETQQYCYPLQ